MPGSIELYIGPMFSGKCFGKHTMFPIINDENAIEYVAVQDIMVGQHLIGHDGTLRKVISTCTGEDDMYELTYNVKGQPDAKCIIVTQDHVLCLVDSSDKFIDVALNIYIKNSHNYEHFAMYRIINGALERIEFMYKPMARGTYYGFTVSPIIDRPERVITNDGLVVHNTIQLLNRLERHYHAKRKCLIIQHKLDKRYDHLSKNGGLICNDGNEYTFVQSVRTEMLADVDISEYDVIGVNEAQFYPDLLLVDDWANAGKIVIVDGLDGDTSRDNFGQIHKLLPKCERVTKLSAVCTQCGADAPFTVKIGESQYDVHYVSGADIDPIKVDIGGANMYMPVCRVCYHKTLK